jgi:hypothetical protein
MKLTRDIVGLALLRRIARALERGNEIAQYRCDREFPPLSVKPGKGERRGIVVSRQTEGPTNAARKDIIDILEEIDRGR